MNYSLVLGGIILLFATCNKANKSIEKIQKEWIGKEIIIPESLPLYYNGDTISKVYEGTRLIITVNGECWTCIEELEKWKLFINKMKEINDQIKVIYYINVEDYGMIKDWMKLINFKEPFYVDKNSKLYKSNNLPLLEYCPCILINANNVILSIGNPLKSNNVRYKFEKNVRMTSIK